MAKRPKQKKGPPERNQGEVGGAKVISSGNPPSQFWWQRDELRAVLLILAVGLAYQPVWQAGIIWDDDQHIIGPDLQSWAGLGRIWFQLGATQQYYPVVYTVFWVERHLWGDAPLGYHLVNVLLHITSALLVVKILRRLEVPGAWLGAALWALHPVQVESVAWVSELKNTLSGLCYLAGALVYLRFDREGKWRFYWFALGLFVVGLLAKTVIATLPAALLLIFLWKRKKLRRKEDILPLLPFFIAGLGSGLFTAWVERTYVMENMTSDFNFSPLERLVIAGRDIWFYLGKLAWPHPLIFIYPRWNIEADGWRHGLYPVSALLLAAGLWRYRGRLGEGPLVAFLFFAGTLFPALGFFDVYPFRYSFVADHFQYLASLGPLALAGAGMTRAFGLLQESKRLPAAVVGGLLIFTLGLLTWRQATTYKDIETLWRATIAHNPECWLAHNNLGFILSGEGRVSEAIQEYETAIKIEPDFPESHNNLGNDLSQTGRLPEAIEEFEEALRLAPDYPEAHNGLGTALSESGRFSEALDHCETAVRLRPNDASLRANLGVVLLHSGRVADAIQQFETALQISPENAKMHNSLGDALLHAGRVSEAIEQCSLALQIEPDVAEAHYNLGNGLFMANRLPEAIAQYEAALKIKPDFAAARDNLAKAQALLKATPSKNENGRN